MPYDVAVLRSAAVPFGWIIGCPLLGWISDRIGRRKPVIIVAAAVLLARWRWASTGLPACFRPTAIALVAGIASGAAMIPYTVIKEANRPEHSGTATGVINFINFSFSALLGPMFAARLMRISGGGERELGDYQATFMPMLFGIALAILLALLLRETGPRRADNEARHLAPGSRPNETHNGGLNVDRRHGARAQDGKAEKRGEFKPGLWTKEINVRNFIQLNYEPYYGDESFPRRPDEADARQSGRS